MPDNGPMVAYRIDWPHDQSVDANSAVRSGAKFYVYANETTTQKTLYSDRAGLVTRANPVVANSAGEFPVVYVDSTDLLTLVLTTAAGVQIGEDWDNIEPEVSTDLTQLSNYVARAGGDDYRMTGPLELKEGASVASATSIDLDAATGNTVHITGTTTINTVSLDQGSYRTCIFDGALQLTHSVNLLLLGSTNIVTVAGDIAVFYGEGSGVTRLVDYTPSNGRPLIESADVLVAVGDETTPITTGTSKITFRMPFAMTLSASALPRASLTTAQASGNIVTIDINESGSSILSTKLTIDNSELTSESAATPAVLSDTTIADNAVITIDIDQCDGSTAAAGLKVLLRGYRHNRS